MLLQEGDRCLVQVYDGGYACEQYADVEDRADDTAGRHCVEYVYEVNEHQAGAAGYVVDAFAQNNCHCRNDNECCQQSCDGIKYCNVACGGRDILALGQVGTVDYRAVACNGQGEECLTECKYPQVGLSQTSRIQGQNVLIACGCAGQRADVDCQYEEQTEQNRHHDLVCLLNAACNAHYHDGEGNDQCNDLPYAVADAEEAGRRHCLEGFGKGLSLRCGHAERAADSAHIRAEAEQAAGEGHEGVLEDPAENDRVADCQHQCTDDRDCTDCLTGFLAAGALLGTHAERTNRTCSCTAAESELLNNAGTADQNYKDEIGKQEGHAAVLLHHDRETPDVAHTNRRTDTCQNETPLTLETISLF